MKYRVVIAASVFALSMSLSAAPADPPCYIPADVISVYDGDTIRADVDMPWNVTLRNQTIRVHGYDAWEITRGRRTVVVTAEEIIKGRKARDDLKALLKTADGVYLSPVDSRDPYGRLSATLHVIYDGEMIHVVDWMLSHGHVRGP